MSTSLKPLLLAVSFGAVAFGAQAREDASAAPTLCQPNEQAILACTLQGSGKRVALCAAPVPASAEAPQADANAWSVRYRYGRPGRIELSHPATGDGAGAFSATHTVFAGATGGRTYAFSKGPYKYILYSVSGTGVDYAGLQVQQEGRKRPLSDRRCQPASVVQSENESLFKATSAWPEDPALVHFRSER